MMKLRGFTLVEMLVSVGIFSLVMVIALGSLLSLSEANRRAQLLTEATNNFNSALDSMTRSIRTGTNYHCSNGIGNLDAPNDCDNGWSQMAFTPAGSATPTAYMYSTTGCTNNVAGCILRSTDGGATYTPITSPDIIIDYVQFYIEGSPNGIQQPENQSVQPIVRIIVMGHTLIKSTATAGEGTVYFNIQTSVTQRIYDQ
jgi:prepilin-type N-terminal cleavage/methylation domain-containing protein